MDSGKTSQHHKNILFKQSTCTRITLDPYKLWPRLKTQTWNHCLQEFLMGLYAQNCPWFMKKKESKIFPHPSHWHKAESAIKVCQHNVFSPPKYLWGGRYRDPTKSRGYLLQNPTLLPLTVFVISWYKPPSCNRCFCSVLFPGHKTNI